MRTLPAAVLAVLLFVAGVGAGGMLATPAAAPGAEASTATDGSVTAATNHSAAYRATIPSVVSVRVDSDQGGATGSGFVYDRRGHVVTNEHVVGDAERVVVQFGGETAREGEVVGTDAYTDLAVVAVSDPPADAAPLPVASRDPVPGQPVAALGSPFGLEGTITVGVVSGVDRSMPTERGFTIPATVQTDAAINPGNSGGPLVALDGPAARGGGEVEATVVGVNVARARQSDNVGFAISPRIVERVVPSLVADGHYPHSFVGIRTVPVTPASARANGLPNATGAHVVDVLDGGPADGTLVAANGTTTVDGREVPDGGDTVVALDGRPVRTNEDLGRLLLLHTSPGDEVTFTVYRDGTRQRVTTTLGERPPP